MAVATADGYKDVAPMNVRFFYGVEVKPGSIAKQTWNLSLTRPAQLSGRLIDRKTKTPLVGFVLTALESTGPAADRRSTPMLMLRPALTAVRNSTAFRPAKSSSKPRGGHRQFRSSKQAGNNDKLQRPTGYPRRHWPEPIARQSSRTHIAAGAPSTSA